VAKRQVVIFLISGARYPIEVEHAAALADRLHNRCGGDIEHPAYSAAVLIDRAIEGQSKESPDWHAPETGQLAWAIHEWLDEVGASALPEPIHALRYALFGEHQDALPAGIYLFHLDHGNFERDVPRRLDHAPANGQAVTIEGRTYIVQDVTPSTGSEHVANVRAHLHPG
jgi:hypothetical protein